MFIGGVDIGEKFVGTGDMGFLFSRTCGVVGCTTVVVASILNGLVGRFRLLTLGGIIDVCLLNPCGVVASFELEPSVIIFGSGKATDVLLCGPRTVPMN